MTLILTMSRNAGALLLCVAALVSWTSGALFSEDDFVNYVYLDEDEVVQFLFTKLNDSHVEIGVICDNPGWCAVGISPNGNMPASDIMFFWVDDSTSCVYLQDRYASGRTYPTLDESQDLTLISGAQEDGKTYVRFIRNIENCADDEYDLSFETGTSRVLYAYNSADPTEVEWVSSGVSQHLSGNMGHKSVNVLTYVGVSGSIPDNALYADIRMPENTVPDYTDTTYYCGLTKLPVVSKTHHMVAIEALVQEGNEAIIHHMIMYKCPSSLVNDTHVGQHANCNDEAEMGQLDDCDGGSPIYSWAIGGEAFYFPDHVGYPMGGDAVDTDDSVVQYVLIQIHYDNPNFKSGVNDTSGFRVWYTSELRENNASSFWAGLNVDPRFHFIPSGLESVTNFGFCLANCTERAGIPEDGVSIIASFLHAHNVGTALKASIIRNNTEVIIIDENRNYDFNYQATTLLSEEITLLPGDSIYMECVYNTENRDETTVGGEASSQEMCIVSLVVYPPLDLGFCQSQFAPYYKSGDTTPFVQWLTDGASAGYLYFNNEWIQWNAEGSDEDATTFYNQLWQDSTYWELQDHWCNSVTENYRYKAASPFVTEWLEDESTCTNETEQVSSQSEAATTGVCPQTSSIGSTLVPDATDSTDMNNPETTEDVMDATASTTGLDVEPDGVMMRQICGIFGTSVLVFNLFLVL